MLHGQLDGVACLCDAKAIGVLDGHIASGPIENGNMRVTSTSWGRQGREWDGERVRGREVPFSVDRRGRGRGECAVYLLVFVALAALRTAVAHVVRWPLLQLPLNVYTHPLTHTH